MHELQKNDISPREVTDLSALRSVSSTGMVLPDASFEWFYDVGFPPSVQLENISGGTDLAGCFAMGNHLTPVYVGGCQGPSLGTAIAVYDQTLEGGKGVRGRELPHGQPGELVAWVKALDECGGGTDARALGPNLFPINRYSSGATRPASDTSTRIMPDLIVCPVASCNPAYPLEFIRQNNDTNSCTPQTSGLTATS